MGEKGGNFGFGEGDGERRVKEDEAERVAGGGIVGFVRKKFSSTIQRLCVFLT